MQSKRNKRANGNYDALITIISWIAFAAILILAVYILLKNFGIK